MYLEILIFAAILLFLFNYSGRISANKFIEDNTVYLKKLKEDDWDFYVKAKYGDNADTDILFN